MKMNMDPCEQIKTSHHKHIRVLAGPGTGKTTSMMGRVARLIRDNINPRNIFVVTFTRTAANDLITQLSKLQIDDAKDVCASTLHSFCFGVLNREEILQLTGRNPRPLLAFEEKYLLYDLDLKFGGFRQRDKRLKAFEAAWARLQTDEAGWPSDQLDKDFQYEIGQWLNFHKAILIGELVPIMLNYLRNNPECAERKMFEHVLVDEYQDLNKADQTLVNLLHQNSSVLVIGDDNQSIYGFRYAHPEAIADHPADAEIISIQDCYRLPKKILAMANALFPSRPLQPIASNEDGEIYNVQWQNADEEAKGIAKIIIKHINDGKVVAGRVLVLAPNRDIGYRIRDEIAQLGINVRSYFQEDALDKELAQEKWTLLTLLNDPNDGVALRVWLGFGNSSKRTKAYKKVLAIAENSQESVWNILGKVEKGELQIKGIKDLMNRFGDLKMQLAELKSLSIQEIVEKLLPDNVNDIISLRKAAQEVVSMASNVSDLFSELKTRITQPELPIECDFVRVMSLHKSKGLTADFVVMAGCVDAFMPSRYGHLTQDEQIKHIQEQKRLFYVAMTRSRKYLFISSFLQIQSNRANRMGGRISYRGRHTGQTMASRFITDLGTTAPSAISGSNLLSQLGIPQ